MWFTSRIIFALALFTRQRKSSSLNNLNSNANLNGNYTIHSIHRLTMYVCREGWGGLGLLSDLLALVLLNMQHLIWLEMSSSDDEATGKFPYAILGVQSRHLKRHFIKLVIFLLLISCDLTMVRAHHTWWHGVRTSYIQNTSIITLWVCLKYRDNSRE